MKVTARGCVKVPVGAAGEGVDDCVPNLRSNVTAPVSGLHVKTWTRWLRLSATAKRYCPARGSAPMPCGKLNSPSPLPALPAPPLRP